MKILLINPPKEKEFALFVLDDYNKKARSNQVPLGLLYLHAYLKDLHEVKIVDMNALEMPIYKISHEIGLFHPDIIGITCVIAKWLTVKALAKEIKWYNSNINVVLGGVNPSLYPWETLQCPDIDYVVPGFGQKPFEKLCNRLEQDSKYYYTKTNCKTKRKGSFKFEDVDEYPMPDRGILPIDDYCMPFFPENPVTSMVTSMGCPYKCHFCACKNFSPVILRETSNIIKEMKQIESIGINGILFNDELFTMNTKRIKDICSAILSENIKLCWSVRSRANLIDRESLELMKKAGCFNIHLGIESGTDRILSSMKKGITLKTIRESVAMIKSVGLSVTASFMMGYPDETGIEIWKTIAFAKELELNNSQFFIVQPEPRTELYEEVKAVKNLPDDIYSEFTLNPDSVDLKNNIASNIFNKKELEVFLKIAYSQTDNLYKLKKSKGEANG